VFYDIVFEIIFSNCIKKHLYPLWFSSMLKDLIYKKRIALMLLKQINYNKFSLLRAKCKFQSELDFNDYIFNIQNSIKTNPKLFFNRKISCLSLSNIMMYDNVLFIRGKDIVDCFAHYIFQRL